MTSAVLLRNAEKAHAVDLGLVPFHPDLSWSERMDRAGFKDSYQDPEVKAHFDRAGSAHAEFLAPVGVELRFMDHQVKLRAAVEFWEGERSLEEGKHLRAISPARFLHCFEPSHASLISLPSGVSHIVCPRHLYSYPKPLQEFGPVVCVSLANVRGSMPRFKVRVVHGGLTFGPNCCFAFTK